MKICELNLIAFGPFTGLRLDLSPGAEGLHLVYGPNEAGKSSALRALRQAFFGIPANSTDNFIHTHSALRLGATLRRADGSQLSFIRRKGLKNTLLHPESGAPLDEALLRDFLGGIEPASFESMCGFSHAMLIEGGEQIARGHGDLGEALFSAAAGLANLRQVKNELDSQADALFRARAQNPLINALLARYGEKQKQLADALLSADAWEAVETRLREAAAERDALTRELQDLRARKSRLGRLGDALPLIARLKLLRADLLACEDAPDLTESFEADLRTLQSTLAAERETLAQAAAALAAAERDLAAPAPPRAILDHAEPIELLLQDLGSTRKAAADLKSRLAPELADFEAELRALLHDLALPDDSAAAPALTNPERATLRALAEACQATLDRETRAAATLADLARQLADDRDALATLPPPAGDPARLARALQQAQRQGDLEAERAQLDLDLAKAAGAAEKALRRLALWSGPPEALETLAVPLAETIESFRDRWEAFDADQRKAADERAEREARLRELDQHLARLAQAGGVPTEEALRAARHQRNAGWTLVRRAWREGTESPAETGPFIAAFAPAADLARAYEASVERADGLADRLRREAQRVADHAALAAERASLTARLAALQDAEKRSLEKLSDLKSSWEALWAPLTLTPLTPREMLAWRRQWEDCAARQGALRELRLKRQTLAGRIEELLRDLGAELQALTGEPPETEPLATRLDRGRAAHEATAARLAERQRLESTIQITEHKILPKAREEAASARDQLTRWQAEWAAWMDRLGLPAAAPPAEANQRLARLDRLATLLAQTGRHRARIKGIQTDAAAFAGRVASLAERAAPALAALPAEEAALELNRLLREAHAETQRREGVLNAQADAQRRRDAAALRIRTLDSDLANLCRLARTETPAALPEAAARSRRKRQLLAEARTIEEKLQILCGAEPLAEFIVHAEGSDVDRLRAELPELDAALAGQERRLTDLAEETGRLKKTREEMAGNDRALELESERQSLLAGLAGHARQAARLRLAAALLRRGLEHFRQRHQDPLLGRAGAFLAELTGGSLAGLAVDYDEKDNPVLVGIRPEGGGQLAIERMSDGTRDQLYLALRLAYLERYAAAHEPLPLVMDDTLINYDNARALATLRVLADLSARMQVIFFTHHAHLLDLAREHLAPGALFIHQLASNGIADCGLTNKSLE